MRSFTFLTGLLSIVGSTIAAPTKEVFEALRAVPEGWAKVRAPNPETRLHLRIALEQPNQALFEETLLAVSTPDHPQYGMHLEGHELKRLLRPRESSTNAVLSWLKSSKVPDSDIEDDGEWINFYTTVANAEAMLDTEFGVYEYRDSDKHSIRTLQYSVPKEVTEHITMIQPTTRFGQPKAQRSTIFDIHAPSTGQAGKNNRVASAIPDAPLNVTACNATITPECLRALYNIGDYEAYQGVGSLLGVAGYLEQYAKFDDLKTFNAKYAPYAVNASFDYTLINGGKDTQEDFADDDLEANLDIQYTVPLAYKTPITYYSTGGRGPLVPDLDQPDPDASSNEPYLEFLSYILKLPNSKLPQTLTTSYGEDEQSVPASYVKNVCNLFGQLGARGVSILFSSGDTGPGSACQTNDGKNITRFLPIFPASCPWVTSVGGTKNVEPEQAVGFSSGGFSDLFPRPDYQDKAVKKYLKILGSRWKGLYNPAGRGFPDVAAQGYRFHIIDKYYRNATQYDLLIGGTR
jgi:tripeptidyl-peptidase-1